jgi:hypothetical protein
MIDLIPFFLAFIMFTFAFSLVVIIMEADSDSVDDDYINVPRFVRVIIQTFRISIGDISVNKYGKWANGNANDKDFLIA